MILAINTASDENSIALYSDQLQKEQVWNSYMTQSQELLPRIDKFLKSHNIKLSDLQAIATYQGPGSYTGLRVGISVANALGWSLDIPVIGIKNCYTATLPNCHKKNNHVAMKQCDNISAVNIAEQAYKVLTNKKLVGFTQPVEPFYGSRLK